MTWEVSISPIWKDRALDVIRFVSVILQFYTIWLVNSGNWEKYNMPLIITIFMVICIVLTVMLGEHMRSLDPTLMALEKEYKRQKGLG